MTLPSNGSRYIKLGGSLVDKFVCKRSGDIVPFDSSKIVVAINKAIVAEDGQPNDFLATELAKEVVALLNQDSDSVVDVEDIQDMVERVLVLQGYYEYAKRYILYREQRRQVRELKKTLNIDLIDSYINQLDWRVKENANSQFSAQGLSAYTAGTVSANYWLNKIYPREITETHISGDMHVHDLGSGLVPYCTGWDFQQLLEEGYGGVPGQVSCTPPKHFHSAIGQLVSFMFSVQQDCAGAVAVSNFDTLLAPFVHADRLDYRDVKQYIQEFVYQMNMPGRTGMQRPFTNLTLDFTIPGHMQNLPAIVGGKPYGVYGDFQEEAEMVARAFFEVMLNGDGAQQSFPFPIPTVNVAKDFQWDLPAVKTLMAATARFGTPYFANFVSSGLDPADARSMCCRLRLDLSELRRKGGGLFGAEGLTGSIGVCTINLPRLGYLSSSRDEYFQRLGRLVDLAVRSLNIKRELVEAYTEGGLHPFARRYLRNVKAARGSYWANHFGTIGVVGMNEACLNLLGVDIAHPDGYRLAEDTLNFIRDILVKKQQEYGLMYNLEATPAEGCSPRLARLDKQHYPDIIVANETAYQQGTAPYYSNSTMLPVNYTSDLFAALNHQSPLLKLYTGGSVFHVFIGERQPDPDACAALIKKIFSRYELPYMSLTPTYSVCPAHGYIFGRHHTCPTCGAKTEIYSRVVGYFRPISSYSAAKVAEFYDRAMFDLAFTA